MNNSKIKTAVIATLQGILIYTLAGLLSATAIAGVSVDNHGQSMMALAYFILPPAFAIAGLILAPLLALVPKEAKLPKVRKILWVSAFSLAIILALVFLILKLVYRD